LIVYLRSTVLLFSFEGACDYQRDMGNARDSW